MTALDVDLDALVDRLGTSGRKETVAEAMRLLGAGVPATRIIHDFLRPLQEQVGERWARNEWTVADEHAATAVVDAALTVLSANASAEGEHRGHVVIGCVEGDFHALPSRMVAETLALRGFDVTYLGASLPADHLARFVANTQPLAVALSCAVAMHLPGAARTIEAARRHGTPVIVGGRAFGDDGARAGRLRADAWAPDVDAMVEVLARWVEAGPSVEASGFELPAEVRTVEDERVGWAMRAFEILVENLTVMASYDDRQLKRTLEDLSYLLRFAAAAVLVDDRAVWDDFLEWHVDILDRRGVPLQVFPPTFDALLAVVPTGLVGVRGYLEAGRQRTSR